MSEKIPVFILSYRGSQFLEQYFHTEVFPNADFYIIDNGKQKWDRLKNNVLYTTTRNIGCAGGWNLCSKIGFYHFNFEKILISNDDNMFNSEIVDLVYNNTNPKLVQGTYSTGFAFSLFGIHNETYKDVGEFDENFIYVTCEDNDYMHRCKLKNVECKSLDVSNKANLSLSSGILNSDVRSQNARYIAEKWGEKYEYIYPFNNENYIHKPIDIVSEIYSVTNNFPSDVEFEIFKEIS
jgi:hypothetical protein